MLRVISGRSQVSQTVGCCESVGAGWYGPPSGSGRQTGQNQSTVRRSSTMSVASSSITCSQS